MSKTQQRASDPTRSVWVSAHAGTGKTKMLVDRVLRLLLMGAAPESLLCITYTKAAAAEMRERIDAQLQEWSQMDLAEIAQDITKMTGEVPDMATVEKAHGLYDVMLNSPYDVAIQTIHAFCQGVLQQFPLEAGIAPHFTMIDEAMSKTLVAEAKHRILFEADETKTPYMQSAWTHIATHLADATIDDLLDSIVFKREQFQSFWQMHGDKDVDEVKRLFDTALNAPSTPVSSGSIYADAPHALCYEYMHALLKGTAAENKRAATVAAFLEKQGGDAQANLAYQSLFLKKDGAAKAIGSIATKATLQSNAALPAFISEECDRLAHLEEQRKSQAIAQDSVAVAYIARALLDAYDALKRARGVLDFSDVIYHTQALLAQPDKSIWIRFKLDRYVRHLLLDEAQDTNFSQWMIVRTLMEEWLAGDSENRSLFVVGDYKQSIYRFQGAQPESFVGMQQAIAQQTESVYGAPQLHEETLDVSYRSTAPVLEVVDAVFANSGLSDAPLTHHVHREGQAGSVELWPLLESEKAELPDPWHPLADYHEVEGSITTAAHHIADHVRGLLDSALRLESYDRAIEPDDIMILLQKRGRWSQALTQALQHAGVPVSGRDRLILNDEMLVQDLLAIAQHCLLPDDDLVLAGVLKGPLCGFSEEALFAVCHEREGSLLDALTRNSIHENITHRLTKWRTLSQTLSPLAWYRHLLYVENIEAVLLAHHGAVAQDILHAFVSQLENYESQFTPSLQGFCEWMSSGNSQIKRDMTQGENAVRIMTVHAAKGLQAPLVILPDTTHVQPFKQSIFTYEHDKTLLPLYVSGKEYDNPITAALRDSARLADEQERQRLLYVALTRAEEWLIVCGVGSADGLKEQSWYAQVQAGMEGLGCVADSDDMYIHALEQTAVADKVRKNMQPQDVAITSKPDWIDHREASDDQRISENTTKNDDGTALSQVKRGILMHTILQWNALAHEDPAQLRSFLQQRHPIITDEETAYFQNTLKRLHACSECREILLARGLHEVPVVSQDAVSGGLQHHQIDKLIVESEEVHVVDYKTTSLPPVTVDEVAPAVIKQLARYRSLVSQHYPEHRVICHVLWTHNATLMTLPDALVDSAAQNLDVAA